MLRFLLLTFSIVFISACSGSSRTDPYTHEHLIYQYEIKYGDTLETLNKSLTASCHEYDHRRAYGRKDSSCPKHTVVIKDHSCDVLGNLYYQNTKIPSTVCVEEPIAVKSESYTYHYPTVDPVYVDVPVKDFINQHEHPIERYYDLEQKRWSIRKIQ